MSLLVSPGKHRRCRVINHNFVRICLLVPQFVLHGFLLLLSFC
ncbi:unnamed protein product [Spirodela intermedia]|uniref:Uncharacterized protein n=2 Tax=Spirodela intermedia TaxID=51605 RepID=A0A7I8L1Y6_SPIIN|nr:unnamed protein product [Spirodela intermedia]CAA6666934.1 unnamed protein product [Spirodela intermedia]CAA7403742.1 unnamed protein product [Spirodela intermedia]